MRARRVSIISLLATVLLLVGGPGNAAAEPPWSQELTVTTAAALNSYPYGLAVASNARGDAAVLWWETKPRPSGSGSGPALLAMTRSEHGPWSTPRTLLVSSELTPGFVDAAVSPTGAISVVLTTQLEPTDPSTTYEIRGQAGGAWNPPVPMVAQGQPISGPVVARDVHSGRDLAAWFVGTGSSRSVRVASRTSGGPWSTPTVVATSRAGAKIDWYLSAAVRGTRSVVAWSVDRGTSGNGPHDIAAAIDSGNGTWPVETVATSLSVLTRVAALIPTDATATVAWVSRYPVSTDDTLYVSRRDASDWSAAKLVKRDLYGRNVALLAPATGGLVAGYQSSATKAAISELRADGTWNELTLSTPGIDGIGPVSLASDELGNLAAGWHERIGALGLGAKYANHVRTRPADTGTWAPATAAAGPSPEAIGYYYDPLVAMTSGGPLATWFVKASGPSAIALAWVDRMAPAIDVGRPTDLEQVAIGDALSARFSCSDEQHGTGLAATSGCVAHVERPDGSTYPVVDEQRLDTEKPGTYIVVITALDRAGNARTVRSRYVVATPAPGPGTGPGINPDPGSGGGAPGPGINVIDPPSPGKSIFVAPPATTGPGATPKTGSKSKPCPIRGVKLLAVQDQGRGSRRKIQITGFAPRTWSGKRVDVRLGARRIARTRVRRDGTIRLTVRHPSNVRNGTYRLAIGRSLSNRMKAARSKKVAQIPKACR